MKSNIKVNAMEQTISVSKAFYKKACVYGSPEYRQLIDAQRNNPAFDIKFKEYEKNTYNGLNLAKMREYILTQDNSEDRLVEFEAVIAIAKAKRALYPLTKKWFLETYPEYKESTINPSEKAKADARAARENTGYAALAILGNSAA